MEALKAQLRGGRGQTTKNRYIIVLNMDGSFNGRFPTMYLSYSYKFIATHKIFRTPYLGAPLLGG